MFGPVITYFTTLIENLNFTATVGYMLSYLPEGFLYFWGIAWVLVNVSVAIKFLKGWL